MNTFRNILVGCFCIFSSPQLFSQSQDFKLPVIYLVRHAEKDTGNNPAISLAGKKRAGDLYRALKNKKIDLIYISQYRRTGMTGDSLRIYNSIDSIHYMADATGDLLFKKIKETAGKAKNILIIGHSNTLPVIIRKAGVKDYTLKEIPDHEYDNLFIIKQRKKDTRLLSKKFGDQSAIPEKATKMNSLQ